MLLPPVKRCKPSIMLTPRYSRQALPWQCNLRNGVPVLIGTQVRLTPRGHRLKRTHVCTSMLLMSIPDPDLHQIISRSICHPS